MILAILATIYEIFFGKLTESPGYMVLFFCIVEIFVVYPILIMVLIWKDRK